MRRFILSTRIIILTILIGTFGGLALVLVITIAGSVSTNIKPYYSTPIYLIILLMPALSGALIGYAWDCSRSRRLSRYTESRRAAGFEKLPVSVTDFIAEVIKKMRYRRRVRRDVELELICYFNDAINDFKTDEEKNDRAQTLIEQFGDPKLLAQLIRRAKKRSRPIWKKALIRTAQATAALLLFFCLYTWWFVTGKPNITIDYVARLNQMVRTQVPDDQNAWPYYQKAIDQFAKPNKTFSEIYQTIRLRKGHVSFASLSVTEQKAMRKWLGQNEPVWAEFLTAGQIEHCWINYQTSSKDQEIIDVLMPPLGAMKALSRLGIWKARLLIENGETQEALDQCLSVIRTAKHFQHAPWIIEQLTGLAISRDGHNEILHIIHTANLSSPQLADLQNRLAAVYQDGYPKMNFEFEWMAYLDIVQYYFTDGGPGGGHLLSNFTPLLEKISVVGTISENISEQRRSAAKKPRQNVFDSLKSFFRSSLEKFRSIQSDMGVDTEAISGAMIHAGRHDTLKAYHILYDIAKKENHLAPWQRHVSTDPKYKNYVNSLHEQRYLLVHELNPSFGRASELVWRGKAVHEATLTVLALHRWKLQKGSFPDSLEELIDAGFLERLPLDPYNDGPLTYKKQGDDFILYSYAGDFDDDQGRQNPETLWAEYEKSSDRLFWPLETPTPSSTDL